MNVFKTSMASAAVLAGSASPARAQLAKATLIGTFTNPIYVTSAPYFTQNTGALKRIDPLP